MSSSPSASLANKPQDRDNPPPRRLAALLDHLPPWIATNLRSRRSWKMFLRCWLASWVSFVILLPDKSLRTLGNAAFFAILGSIFVPPNMPIQIFLFALLTIVLGVCLGWAFGVAAMRAALAARNQVLLRETLQKQAQSTAGLADPDALFEASIFMGTFLDTHSSAVYGVFLGVSSFLFALMRAYVPRLIITSVFATISIDILCSYGPLFPFPEYTLLNSLLTSLACYIAIGIVVILFVFPETLNHSLLGSLSNVLAQAQSLIEIQEDVLTAPVTDLGAGGSVLTRVISSRERMMGGFQGFTQMLPMLNMEFSWGRWNGDDIQALERPLSAAMARLAALQSFAKMLGRELDASATASRASVSAKNVTEPDHLADSTSINMGDTELLRQLRSRDHTHTVGVPLADVIPYLRDATSELRASCVTGFAACKVVVDVVNTKRYAKGSGAELDRGLAELDAAGERLTRALEAFKEKDRLAILEPFRPVFDAELGDADRNSRGILAGNGQGQAPLRSLFIVYVFAVNMIAVGQSLKGFVESLTATAHKRRRNRLWAPKSLRMLGHVLTQRGTPTESGTGEDPTAAEEEDKKEDKEYRLDPDARPPSNVVQRIANALHSVYLWAKTPEAMFAFKYTVLTIALWIPSVVKRSAHFVYAERGLWALIMAQTTLNIYAADQIFNYVVRLAGTFIGAVYGLLTWYIGSAKSRGSPYGTGASVAVFLIPLVFARIFAPAQYLSGVLMVCATWVLIVGYSWVDGHIPVVGNVGIGWSIAWRRWVLVMIGCAASFIIMILPPTSARKSVRLRCVSTMSALSYIYSHLMAAWINDSVPSGDEKAELENADWLHEFRERLISVTQKIQALRVQASIAKFEGNIRGAWPSEEYSRLVEVESEMLGSLAILGGSLMLLGRQTRLSLLQYTRVVNPHFISDMVSTFLHVSQSLRTGEPLHQAQYQDLVDRAFYHTDLAHPGPAGDEQSAKKLRYDRIQSVMSYEYMFYAGSVVAVFQLMQNLNEARTITARLCGEVQLEGFDEWRGKYGLRSPVP